MSALFLIVALFASESHATAPTNAGGSEFATRLQTVAALPYLEALPELRGLAGHDEQVIADLNAAYESLKKDGISAPTVRQVAGRYRQTGGLSESADLGTICVLAVVAGLGYGSALAYVRGRPKVWAAIQEASGGGSTSCNQRLSGVIDSSKRSSESAKLRGGEASS